MEFALHRFNIISLSEQPGCSDNRGCTVPLTLFLPLSIQHIFCV